MHLVCPTCASTNRVPDERLDDEPVCGRCGAALMAPEPAALSDATLPAYIARTELPVVVDFWADWCGPCKMMAPQFAAAAARMPRVRFAKLDTEANPQSSRAFDIRSIPTLILFQGGRERGRHSGAIGAADLQGWIRQQLGPTA